jgi:hypothetical protein
MTSVSLLLVSIACSASFDASMLTGLNAVQFQAASQAMRLPSVDTAPDVVRLFSRGRPATASELAGSYSGKRLTPKGPVDFVLDPQAGGAQIRVNGDMLVARFSNGDYGYFDKKVR